ncbi:PorV/PorQ family protein [Porphyromonas sp.]|uniref:PorV/PorQ family protein n=1 Tax=Porphyromonas sp. TaxID=1924944 RepID=UPI0026DB49A1|nr:PorV/PorQ family protein [Porphyromonas sp.]MDO4771564.1 PorV/PorQ family protein [Porphyromonas sp.]
MRLLYTLLGAILIAGSSAYAQGRALPILEANPDARTAAMGNVTLGHTDANHLYVNPASLLYGSQRMAVNANGELYPKYEDAGRRMYGNANVGLKIGERHGVFAGFRYLGGLSIKFQEEDGERPKTIKPFSYTADLGYAFRLSDHFAFYGMGSFVQDYVTKAAYTMTFDLGANYRRDFGGTPSNPYKLNLGLRVSDFGPALAYSKSKTYQTPASVTFGGDVSRRLGEEHKFTYALGGRYFFLPSDASLLRVGTGLEYTWADMIALRGGYEYAQKGASHFTAGVGVRLAGFQADFAYRGASSEQGENTMMCTIGFTF